MSRKPHEPTPETRKLVRSLAGVGQDQEDIADQVGISPKTLRLRYRDELDEGKAEANAAVIAVLYEMICDGNISAAIFADKCRGGKPEEPPTKEAQKVNKFTDPRWKEYWAYRAAQTRELCSRCDPERCLKAVEFWILFELGVSMIHGINDESFRRLLTQIEAYIRISEKEVETQAPYYEV